MGTSRFLSLAAVLAVTATAQEYRGRVQGLVSDATDAVIAGATVRLRNVGTGVEAQRPSDFGARQN